MTTSDRGFGGPFEPAEGHSENRQDIVPATERSQDPTRSTHDLVTGSARPLSAEDRKAADRDSTIAEPVYAPASERVPKTVPDYGDVVSRTDTHTPERQAAATHAATAEPMSSTSSPTIGSTGGPGWATEPEPSFTRVPRPSVAPTNERFETAWDTDAQSNRWMASSNGGSMLPMGLGWGTVAIAGGVGVWLWMRWRRERNKPINRIRRQARQAAGQARQAADQARQRAMALRDQMPDLPEIPDEATRPAMGVGTALLSLAIVLWQQSQARSRADMRAQMSARSHDATKRADKATRQARKMGKQAVETMSEVDWMERLQALRDLWSPTRVELEKVSIPRK